SELLLATILNLAAGQPNESSEPQRMRSQLTNKTDAEKTGLNIRKVDTKNPEWKISNQVATFYSGDEVHILKPPTPESDKIPQGKFTEHTTRWKHNHRDQ
ncbi:MAG: hypothetical protein AAGD09_04590, partial [Cyanobacteria bacterium P01_F01_bin.56]